MLSRSNLQTGIFIAGQQRREAAGILSAGAVIDESCNELVTDQIVDDNVEGVLRKQRILRVTQRNLHDLCAVQRTAGLPKELHHRKFGIR